MDRIHLEEELAKIITKQSINSYLSFIIILTRNQANTFQSAPASTLPVPAAWPLLLLLRLRQF
eukprot:scaffold11370_cov197-Skeletonema_dohrnii-CCMP3373.AAC.2